MNVTKGALPRTLIDTMNSSGFTQVLKEPTYRTLNGADHFLDLVFSRVQTIAGKKINHRR